jgi:hypothetical protein
MKTSKLIGTWLKSYVSKKDGVRRHIYAVSGNPKALAEYAEFQGENLKHLDDDEDQPMLFFSRTATKRGEIALRINEESGEEYYSIDVDFESAVMLTAIENRYSNSYSAQTAEDDTEEETPKKAEEPAVKPKKRITRKTA